MWWCVTTLTSVGYGDLGYFPMSTGGRFLAVLTMLSGIVVLAMPIGVIGSNFTTELRNHKQEKRRAKEEREREWLQIQEEMAHELEIETELEERLTSRRSAGPRRNASGSGCRSR